MAINTETYTVQPGRGSGALTPTMPFFYHTHPVRAQASVRKRRGKTVRATGGGRLRGNSFRFKADANVNLQYCENMQSPAKSSSQKDNPRVEKGERA